MLTGEHAIVRYERGKAIPDRLVRSTHAHYVDHATAMLDIYRRGIGKSRRELHKAVEALFHDEAECPPRRISSFCKLLDDASVFTASPDAWRLRLAVFREAARHHPLVEQTDRLFENSREEIRQAIAAARGISWPELEAGLYADVLDFQPLETFTGYDSPSLLLSRYNIAQLQACLYKASRLVIHATADFKTILRQIKLARLLHRIARRGDNEYAIELTGPASILMHTGRYGVNMARFLPSLLACTGWSMEAEIITPWKQVARLVLSDQDGFTSHLQPPEEFDSSVCAGSP